MANKLELNWAGKHDGFALVRDEATGRAVQVPYDEVQPRLLVEAGRYGDGGADNILISGENLYALKTLAKSGYAGQIKCVYIDPPYNTGHAFAHYDDALEHSLWLDMMHDRVVLLKELLADDGSIWISIDDKEGHYAKNLCDEVFGRDNFIATFVWQKVDSPNENNVPIAPDHEFILCYSRKPGATRFKQKQDLTLLAAYRTDRETGRLYRDRLLKKNGKNSLRSDRPSMFFAVKDPDGNDVYPIHDDGQEARWSYGRERVETMVANGELIWKRRNSREGFKWVPYTREFAPESPSRPYPTIWTDVLTSRQAKAHQRELLPNTLAFETVKPEQLIARIFSIATDPEDIVLDCFAGSGTTGAVALKMNRRFIMVEAGAHCETHIVPRLRKVIDGTDQGGISPLVPPHPSRAAAATNLIGETKTQLGWTGGGGFRHYTLGKSLIERDAETGVWRLNYANGRMVEAVCLQEGFKLLGRGVRHGVRGRHYAHVADCIVTQDYLDALASELAEDESLTLYCMKAKRKLAMPDGVQLKRLPRDLLTPNAKS